MNDTCIWAFIAVGLGCFNIGFIAAMWMCAEHDAIEKKRRDREGR